MSGLQVHGKTGHRKSLISVFFCHILQERWRRWLTECQRGAGSSWFLARITLLSCWSMSHLACFTVASLWPGGLWFCMCSSTRHWQGSSVMTCILANMSRTQSTEERLFRLCSERTDLAVFSLFVAITGNCDILEKGPRCPRRWNCNFGVITCTFLSWWDVNHFSETDMWRHYEECHWNSLLGYSKALFLS